LAAVLPDWLQAHPTGRNLDPTAITPGLARSLLAESPGRLLAVLDDVWHPEPARALLSALPDRTACLITTRSARIAALGGHNHPLTALAHPDAVALLADRLRVAGNDPDPHADSLDEIARLLDGYALALDLAARQLIERGPEFAPRFIERLRRHLGGETPFKLLILGEGATREDSLEAALFLSYEPLSDDRKAKFRALGVLAPDATIAPRAIFATWGAGSDERPDDDALEEAEDALADLARTGLIARIEGTPRYEMHTVLRTYAAALARRADEYDPPWGATPGT
jgi:hypothetical protein